MPVDPSICPLVSSDEVDVFNELEALMVSSLDELPRLSNSVRFHGEGEKSGGPQPSIKSDWDRIRKDIVKSHYLVGLLGVTGAGKSTTLNRLIGERVLPQGSEGVPCTSVIQRIRFVEPEVKPAVELRFLTQAGWDERRLAIGQALRLFQHNNEISDDDLIEQLQRTLDDDNGQSKDIIALCQFFLRFLKGGKYSRDSLGKTMGPKTLSSMSQLGDVLEVVASHRGVAATEAGRVFGLEDSQSALLSEVQVDIPLNKAPQDLELVDLPGFLARSKQDDVVTKSYLEQLDGACFLISVQGLQYSVFDEMRRSLEDRFGNLQGRVWLVITKIDSAADDQINNERNSIFHGIYKAAVDWNLGADESMANHLLITSSEINKSTQEVSGTIKSTIISTMLKLGPTGTETINQPKALEIDSTLAGIRKSFQHVLHDGGIDRLRSVIQDELAKQVRWQFRRTILRTVESICDSMSRLLEAFRDQGGLKPEDYHVATIWSNLFVSRMRERNLVRGLIPSEIDDFRRQLKRLLDDYCPKEPLPEQKDLPQRHKMFSSALVQKSMETYLGIEQNQSKLTGAISGIAGLAVQRLREQLVDRGRRENLSGRSKDLEAVIRPCERFFECASDILNVPSCRSIFEGVACEEIFSHSNWPLEVDPSMYRSMMERKIDNVIFESIHRLQNCLVSSLEEVQQRLENLDGEADGKSVDTVPRDVYQGYIDQWSMLKEKASIKYNQLSQSRP